MKSFRIAALILILASLVSVLFQRVEGQEQTLMDQAVSSGAVRRMLIAEYESSPQSFRDDRLLAVAISYAVENQIPKARPIYEQFLKDHPNHPRALRGVGANYLAEQRYDEAIVYLRKAWSLKDVDSLSMLAASYVKSERYAQMTDLIPSLLQYSERDAELVNWLVAYAIFYKDPPDVKLVLKALASLRDEAVFLRDDTTLLISEVLARFGRSPELELAQVPIILKVIRGYEANPKTWPANRRTQAADCYCLAGKHTKAEPIYREVLKDSLDEVGALRGLGIALAYQHKFKEGIVPLRNAWDKGDKLSLSALAACHLGARDFDGMKDLIPRLLECRRDDFESLNFVIMYALGKPSPDRELFFKAIDGFTDDQLLRNEEVAHNTILGMKLFGEKKRAEHLQKMKTEQERGKKA